MKTRRLLAILLGIVVAVSSEGMTLAAFAAEPEVISEQTIAEPDAADEIIADEQTTEENTEITDTTDAIEEDNAPVENLTASAGLSVDADGVLTYSGGTFSGAAVIPAEAKTIPAGIFNNSRVTGITFESDSQLTAIAKGAFEDSMITSIIIPKGVTEISEAAFKNTTSLTAVELEEGSRLTTVGKEAFLNSGITTFNARYVTSIGNSAFSGCKNLANLDLPNVGSIDNYAFNGCSSLGNIAFSSSISYIGRMAFAGSKMTSVNLGGCQSLSMGDSVFEANSFLKTVILPDELDEIPNRAFYNCVKLSDLTIGIGTQTIGESAFEGCTELTEVRTDSVSKFGANAFAGCKNLNQIIIRYPDTDSDDFTIASSAFPNGKTAVKDGKTVKTDTIKGYDGKVQEYANDHGYEFLSLYERHKVTIYTNDTLKNQLDVKADVLKNIIAGTVVNVTVTPKNGNVLNSISVTATEKTPITLKENNDTNQVFSFVMPNEDVTVRPTAIEKSKANSTPLGYEVTAVNEYKPTVDKDGLHFDMSNRSANIIPTDGVSALNTWYFTFSSSSKVVSVSPLGYITTTSGGAANITITSRLNGKKLIVPVNVAKTSDVQSVELVLPEYSKSAKFGTETLYGKDDDKDVALVTYNKSALVSGTRTLEVGIKAFVEGEGRTLMVPSTWKSSNTSVATVASEKSNDNTNKITIKKGSSGESLITVTVNGADGKPTEDTTVQFIVRVADITPRIDSATIEVNSNAKKGTPINITPVYGCEIFNNALTIREGKADGPLCGNLQIAYNAENGKYYIQNRTGKPFEATYKDDKKLFITGAFDFDHDETFAIPLTQVTVIKGAVNPTITMSGKINLFYDRSDMGGTVKLTQNVKSTEVEDIRLVSYRNYDTTKKTGVIDDPDDEFNANFNIRRIDNNTYEITRSGEDLEKNRDKDGKKLETDAIAGYLYIRYDGYTEGMFREIKIPTYTTTPEYVLDLTSATASAQSSGQEYTLRIIDKKTKKVVGLGGLDEDVAESGNIIGLGLSEGDAIFEEPDIKDAKANSYITLKQKPGAASGKAVIYVQDKDWSKNMKFTFNLTVASTMPTVKLSAASAELNLSLPNQAAVISSTVTGRKDVAVTDYDITYTGNAKLSAMGASLISDMSAGADGTLSIGLPSDVTKGSYVFSVRPELTFAGSGDTAWGNPLKLTVKVVDKKPSVTIKGATLKLNAIYPGDETVSCTYKISGLPTGVEGKLKDGSDFAIVPAKTTSPDFYEIAALIFDDDTNSLQVTLTDDAKLHAGKKYTYKLTGLEAECGSGSIAVPNQNITLNLIKNQPAVKVKASGKLNPVDADSAIVYTATLANITGVIDAVTVTEWDDVRNTKYKDPSAQHFEVELDPYNSSKAILRISDDNRDTLKNKKTYKLSLNYVINNAVEAETIVKVTPTQTYPQLEIKQEPTTKIIYASADMDKRNITVSIKQKAPAKNKKALNAKIIGVKYDKATPENVQNAFFITGFDEDEGIATITLVNPPIIPQDKTYKIVLDPIYEGQAGDTTAASITVNITVKK